MHTSRIETKMQRHRRVSLKSEPRIPLSFLLCHHFWEPALTCYSKNKDSRHSNHGTSLEESCLFVLDLPKTGKILKNNKKE